MSVRQELEELDVDVDDLVDDVVEGTIPGRSNNLYKEGMVKASATVPAVIEDLNNWFEILEVRVLDKNHVSMPMRYRWSIIRWAKNDMDEWLMDNGWEDFAHLNADTRLRQDNEMEARYRKMFGDVTVDCNFLVYFPDIVFEKMNNRSDKSIRRKTDKRDVDIDDVMRERRKGNV